MTPREIINELDSIDFPSLTLTLEESIDEEEFMKALSDCIDELEDKKSEISDLQMSLESVIDSFNELEN